MKFGNSLPQRRKERKALKSGDFSHIFMEAIVPERNLLEQSA